MTDIIPRLATPIPVWRDDVRKGCTARVRETPGGAKAIWVWPTWNSPTFRTRKDAIRAWRKSSKRPTYLNITVEGSREQVVTASTGEIYMLNLDHLFIREPAQINEPLSSVIYNSPAV